jgi:hypothetical protein
MFTSFSVEGFYGNRSFQRSVRYSSAAATPIESLVTELTDVA